MPVSMAGQIVPRANYIKAVIIEVVCVVYSLTLKYRAYQNIMCCSRTQAARLRQLKCCFPQEIAKTNLVPHKASRWKGCIGENMLEIQGKV